MDKSRKIRYGIDELTSVEVIREINDCVSQNQQINLQLEFPARDEDIDEGEVRVDELYELFKFDTTIAMQNTIFENSRHIKTIEIDNDCSDKEEHRRCFNFFIKIVLGIIGKGKYLTYISYDFELEEANQLAQALRRSNNNNNGAIESFYFSVGNLKPVTFQPLWNALLAVGVRKIRFGNNYDTDQPINYYNNTNVDFTGMETNTSLKELDLTSYDMGENDCWNLFHAIKKNKGLKELQLNYWNYQCLPTRMKRLFEQMLCENITLLDFRLEHFDDETVQDRIFEVIQFHMELNRLWKRYIMKREREMISRTVITRREERDNNNNNNNNEEEERKKRLKMRLLFRVFHQKPVLRTTILFHLLREYPDDLIDTDHFRNQFSS